MDLLLYSKRSMGKLAVWLVLHSFLRPSALLNVRRDSKYISRVCPFAAYAQNGLGGAGLPRRPPPSTPLRAPSSSFAHKLRRSNSPLVQSRDGSSLLPRTPSPSVTPRCSKDSLEPYCPSLRVIPFLTSPLKYVLSLTLDFTLPLTPSGTALNSHGEEEGASLGSTLPLSKIFTENQFWEGYCNEGLLFIV